MSIITIIDIVVYCIYNGYMLLSVPVEFQWDSGNSDKNLIKHNVTNQEIEEIFFDINKRIFEDKTHSIGENRFIVVGKTEYGRLLYVVCTSRNGLVRVISARDINRKEEYIYEKTS